MYFVNTGSQLKEIGSVKSSVDIARAVLAHGRTYLSNYIYIYIYTSKQLMLR